MSKILKLTVKNASTYLFNLKHTWLSRYFQIQQPCLCSLFQVHLKILWTTRKQNNTGRNEFFIIDYFPTGETNIKQCKIVQIVHYIIIYSFYNIKIMGFIEVWGWEFSYVFARNVASCYFQRQRDSVPGDETILLFWNYHSSGLPKSGSVIWGLFCSFHFLITCMKR